MSFPGQHTDYLVTGDRTSLNFRRLHFSSPDGTEIALGKQVPIRHAVWGRLSTMTGMDAASDRAFDICVGDEKVLWVGTRYYNKNGPHGMWRRPDGSSGTFRYWLEAVTFEDADGSPLGRAAIDERTPYDQAVSAYPLLDASGVERGRVDVLLPQKASDSGATGLAELALDIWTSFDYVTPGSSNVLPGASLFTYRVALDADADETMRLLAPLLVIAVRHGYHDPASQKVAGRWLKPAPS